MILEICQYYPKGKLGIHAKSSFRVMKSVLLITFNPESTSNLDSVTSGFIHGAITVK